VIAVFISLGSFTFGMSLGSISGIIGLESFIEYFQIPASTSYGNSMQGGGSAWHSLAERPLNGPYYLLYSTKRNLLRRRRGRLRDCRLAR
jgi:hypothetical protein